MKIKKKDLIEMIEKSIEEALKPIAVPGMEEEAEEKVIETKLKKRSR